MFFSQLMTYMMTYDKFTNSINLPVDNIEPKNTSKMYQGQKFKLTKLFRNEEKFKYFFNHFQTFDNYFKHLNEKKGSIWPFINDA